MTFQLRERDGGRGPDSFPCVRLPKAHLIGVWISFSKGKTPLHWGLTLCLSFGHPETQTHDSLLPVGLLTAHSMELSRISNMNELFLSWYCDLEVFGAIVDYFYVIAVSQSGFLLEASRMNGCCGSEK